MHVILCSLYVRLCCVQGVHLDECSAANIHHHCTCSDTEPVCPRCGGTRQSRDPVGVVSEGVASMGVVTADHVTEMARASLADSDIFEPWPVAGADDDESDEEKDELHCLHRLHSASETTVTHHDHHPQQRSFSTVTETFSVLREPPTDVGGVCARSAPDSAVSVRQPEIGQGHGGQRSRFQRLFEPLKRSKSTGNHKEAIAAAQASLCDPTRQSLVY